MDFYAGAITALFALMSCADEEGAIAVLLEEMRDRRRHA